VIAAALAAALLAAPGAHATEPAAPARMLVFASEFRLNASRARIPAGRLVLQLRNIGEDDHDLVIRSRRDGRRVAASPELHPGRGAEVRVRLRPGRYLLVCSVADHEQRGMRVELRAAAPTAGRS
jgi:hypothetical protein